MGLEGNPMFRQTHPKKMLKHVQVARLIMLKSFTFQKYESLKEKNHPSQKIPKCQNQLHRMVEIGNYSIEMNMYNSEQYTVPMHNNDAHSSKHAWD